MSWGKKRGEGFRTREMSKWPGNREGHEKTLRGNNSRKMKVRKRKKGMGKKEKKTR